MALKYVVKKTTFGFDDTKAEKYVARPFNVVNVDFKMLCDQVTKVGFVPRGTVKAVLDGLIDSLITYMEIGASVNLGEFGTFRPSFGCKSQENAEEVTTETLKNRKIIFTPGELLKNMIKSVSIQKLDLLLQVVVKKAEETKAVMTAVMKHRTRQYKESFYIVIFRERGCLQSVGTSSPFIQLIQQNISVFYLLFSKA